MAENNGHVRLKGLHGFRGNTWIEVSRFKRNERNLFECAAQFKWRHSFFGIPPVKWRYLPSLVLRRVSLLPRSSQRAKKTTTVRFSPLCFVERFICALRDSATRTVSRIAACPAAEADAEQTLFAPNVSTSLRRGGVSISRPPRVVAGAARKHRPSVSKV